MAESNGKRNGRMAGMAGMAEWQKEWQNGKMAEMDTYVLFMVHADGMTEWRMEWQRMAGMADGMVKWQTEMATYVLFMVHTDDTNDDDNDDTF